MLNKIKSEIFSVSGLSISVGVLGFLAAIVQLFVDLDLQISIKWLLFTLLLTLSLILILLKVIFDVSSSESRDHGIATRIQEMKTEMAREIDRFEEKVDFQSRMMFQGPVLSSYYTGNRHPHFVTSLERKLRQLGAYIVKYPQEKSFAADYIGCLAVYSAVIQIPWDEFFACLKHLDRAVAQEIVSEAKIVEHFGAEAWNTWRQYIQDIH